MPDEIQQGMTCISERQGAYLNGTGQAYFSRNGDPAITHELRAPLTSVRSLSEILRDNPQIDTGRRQEFLGIIIKETERLTHLLDDALNTQKTFGLAQ